MKTSIFRSSHSSRTGSALGLVLSLLTPAVYAQTAPTTTAAPTSPTVTSEVAPVDAAEPAPTTEPTEAPPPPEPVKPAEPPPAAPPAEPAPSAEPATANAALDASAEAEAAAIEAQLSQGDQTGNTDSGYKLDLYGFADFTYSQTVKKFEFNQPYNTFAVGRLNLYLASELGDNWRTLSEVRFTYLPHGVTTYDAVGTPTRTNTTVGDYTDLARPIRWGGIVLERAWLEYSVDPLLNIRAGHWLTPYGIWNVDHGSPVIIGVRRPFIVGESLFPTSQTGLELHGIYHFGSTKLGYHATLSNGRGPLDNFQDLDYNKALGARLYAAHEADWGNLTVGTSFYRGRYTDRTDAAVIGADGDFTTAHNVTVEYKELSWAADVKFESSGFLFQSEAIANDLAYREDLRPQSFSFTPGAPPGFLPDSRRYGVYGLTGYRFDFLGAMPFAGLEYYVTPASNFTPKSAAFWGGLNLRPTPRVVIKAQYTYSWFPGDGTPIPDATGHFNNLDLQAAWSF